MILFCVTNIIFSPSSSWFPAQGLGSRWPNLEIWLVRSSHLFGSVSTLSERRGCEWNLELFRIETHSIISSLLIGGIFIASQIAMAFIDSNWGPCLILLSPSWVNGRSSLARRFRSSTLSLTDIFSLASVCEHPVSIDYGHSFLSFPCKPSSSSFPVTQWHWLLTAVVKSLGVYQLL